MEETNAENNLLRKNLPWVILIVTIPFLYCYFMFFAFHGQITAFQRPSDEMIKRIIDPHVTLYPEHDGIEPKVLFILILFIGPAGFLLFQSSLPKKVLAGISVVLWLVFFIEERFFQNFFSQIITDGVLVHWIKVLLLFLGLVWVSYRLYKKIPLLAQFLIAGIALLVCFIPFSDLSYFDYAFLLAPGLKIAQGAKIADTYFQYDFLPSLPAFFVFKNGWSIYAYRLFVQGALFVFVMAVVFTARKFFVHKSLAFYLFALLVVVRFFMGMVDVTYIPQVTSLRLDWWLLLFICALFGGGIGNKKLGVCFMLLIVVMNSFATIYFVCYLLLLVFLLALEAYTNYRNSQPIHFMNIFQDWLRKYGLNILLGFAGVLLYYLLTGHFINESVSMYSGLQLGMMPVKQDSTYWYFAAAFAVCFSLLLTFRNKFTEAYFHNSLFLLALTAGCSLYFFGRSHDNNVINISGILLFMLMLCCDILLILTRTEDGKRDTTTKALALTPIWIVLTVMMVNNSSWFSGNFRAYLDSLTSGNWTYAESQPEPGALEGISAMTKGNRKVYFMTFNATDFYFYYGGKYDMPSKFNPIDALAILSDKITIINQLLEKDYYVVGVEADYLVKNNFLPKLHYDKYLTNGRYFVLHK